MANPYITIDQFFQMYDQRVMLQLSGDQNASEGQRQTIQFKLDLAAALFDSGISGYVALPMTINPIPLICTWWVATKAAEGLYARRNDKPKQVADDSAKADEWMTDFHDRKVSIPGIGRNEPQLVKSDRYDGRSKYDHIFGLNDGCDRNRR